MEVKAKRFLRVREGDCGCDSWGAKQGAKGNGLLGIQALRLCLMSNLMLLNTSDKVARHICN